MLNLILIYFDIFWIQHTLGSIKKCGSFQPELPDPTCMQESPTEVKSNIGIKIVYLPRAFVQCKPIGGFLYVLTLCRPFGIWFLLSMTTTIAVWHMHCHVLSRYWYKSNHVFLRSLFCEPCVWLWNKLPIYVLENMVLHINRYRTTRNYSIEGKRVMIELYLLISAGLLFSFERL